MSSKEKLLETIEEYGLSESNIEALKKRRNDFSPSELTKIISEKVNINTDYMLLLEFLPDIWVEKNQSPYLLHYISGILHKLLYLIREYPVSKEIPEYLKQEINQIHTLICDFQESCSVEYTPLLERKEEFKTIDELIHFISDYPRIPPKLVESISIVGILFSRFPYLLSQKIRNIDELALYVSRCITLWKLDVLNDKQIISILETALSIYQGEKNIQKFKDILGKEFLNYQFLQLGISNIQVELIAKTLLKNS